MNNIALDSNQKVASFACVFSLLDSKFYFAEISAFMG